MQVSVQGTYSFIFNGGINPDKASADAFVRNV